MSRDLLALLKGVTRSGDGWTALCPAHGDRHQSLSIHHKDGRWLLKCHAGCDWQQIVDALGLDPADFFDDGEGGRTYYPPNNRATAQQPPVPDGEASSYANIPPNNHDATAQQPPSQGLTLDQYAAAKRLPVDFLKALGLSEITYDRQPALRLLYVGEGGEQIATRFRIALEGDRFRWKAGSKPCLYGLSRLCDARKAGQVVLAEGESDCHTFWYHGIPALGLPGAGNWCEERDARHLDGIETIYVVIEPDRGGDAVKKWLSRSSIRHRSRLVSLPPTAKDPSALHLLSPDEFSRRWQVACLGAIPWTALEAQASAEARSEAWERCGRLAREADILDAFAAKLSDVGVVGERRVGKVIYLALTSRLLDRPVSLAIKGPSSGGKSFLTEAALKFFPAESYYALTSMSDRALAYSNEPLKHRHLVIFEAAGLASEFATYLIRSLLSEGCLRYETVEKTKNGLVPRLIEREGPSGLILTTTSLRLHPENEARMLSVGVTDTADQTAAIFLGLAAEDMNHVDLAQWHALQTWLATGPNAVAIPFAIKLASLVPPLAVRLRRDFKTVLMLVRAHALLHQASRRRDGQGRVIAEIEDYRVVRELIADLVAIGVEAGVKPEVREVVLAVGALLREGHEEVRQAQLRSVLQLDKSAISRRVGDAIDGGFLRNLEDRRGRPARLVMGEPLPDNCEVLPAPERLHGCFAVSGDREASSTPGAEQNFNGFNDFLGFDEN